MSIDTFYLAYFLVHIPITIFMDSALVVPAEYRFLFASALLDFHISTNKDFMLVSTPIWLKVFGLFELLFQLPLFFYCSAKLWEANTRKHWVYMVLYGFNAAFTTLVCLVYIFAEGPHNGLTQGETYKLMAIYFPYLAIPAFMMIDYGKRISEALSKTKIE